jgi:hypothetical protein
MKITLIQLESHREQVNAARWAAFWWLVNSENGTPHKAIALKLSVSRPTISRLLGGKTWRQK